MAINQNHTFEDLDGIKCGIVEKNVKPDRVQFLKNLLEFNHYTVVVVPSPPPKISAPLPAAARPQVASQEVVSNTSTPTQNQSQPEIPREPAPATGAAASVVPVNEPQKETQPTPIPTPPSVPETFTVGVTDVTFNPINAIFGRLLRSKDGHIVSLAYWQQKEIVSNDEIPYFDNKA